MNKANNNQIMVSEVAAYSKACRYRHIKCSNSLSFKKNMIGKFVNKKILFKIESIFTKKLHIQLQA